MRHARLALVALLVAGTAHAQSKTDAFRNALTNQFFRSSAITWPSTLNARLYTVCPTTSSSGTEVATSGYSAQAVNPSTSNWAAASSGATSNSNAIAFGTFASNTTVACVGLTDSGGSNLYWFGPVTNGGVVAGETVSFPAGALQVAELQGTSQASAPTFSPAAGAISSGATVTMSSSDSCGAYIYWNTTGSPTTSDTHSTSAVVSTAETLYAKIISCPGFTDSAVASAAYTSGGSLPVTDSFAGTGSLSGNWSIGSGSPSRSGGLICTAWGNCWIRYTGTTFPNDQWTEIVVGAQDVSQETYIGARITVSTNWNGYLLHFTNGAAPTLVRVDNGAQTWLAACGTLTAGHTYRLVASGTTISATDNGSTVCSVTDASWGSGVPGLGQVCSGTCPSITNFQAD